MAICTETSFRNSGIIRLLQVALLVGLLGSAAFADNVTFTPGSFGTAVYGGAGGEFGGACQAFSGGIFTPGPTCFFDTSTGFSNGSASASNPIQSGQSFAQADLGQGFVTAGASTGNAISCCGFGGGFAGAIIWDTLTFHGAAPGATVTIVIGGNNGLQGDASTGVGAILISTASAGGIISPGSELVGNLTSSVVSQPTYSYSQTYAISNGQPMLFELYVHASAGGQFGSGSASISDPFSLQLPDGVTFTSASGEFPSSETPEPSSLLLLAAGLPAILRTRKGRLQ